MLRFFFIPLLLLAGCPICAQDAWDWIPLPDLPESVANNAVVEGYAGDTLCVYSFAGIGEGLEPTDIHLGSWRYNTVSETWMALPDVPDVQGKIAAGASLVDSIIYVIGGYYVDPDLSEESSDDVHRFDPQTNTWLSDGANIPVPIDDHVQCVWRDSLIYVVTGWSDVTNVDDVQIYNPALNTWTAGTPVPFSNLYRAFGASGAIVGDTIYYFGGVRISGFSFVADNFLRKGVINPEDPTQISWSLLPEGPVEDGYRMAVTTTVAGEIIWFGGASVAYNFDALAYSDDSPVEPLEQIRLYDPQAALWEVYENIPEANMDFRGIARGENESWYLAGGIDNNRQVSNALYRVQRLVVGLEEEATFDVSVAQAGDQLRFETANTPLAEIRVFDLSGRPVFRSPANGSVFHWHAAAFPAGVYVVQLTAVDQRMARVKVLLTH